MALPRCLPSHLPCLRVVESNHFALLIGYRWTRSSCPAQTVGVGKPSKPHVYWVQTDAKDPMRNSDRNGSSRLLGTNTLNWDEQPPAPHPYLPLSTRKCHSVGRWLTLGELVKRGLSLVWRRGPIPCKHLQKSQSHIHTHFDWRHPIPASIGLALQPSKVITFAKMLLQSRESFVPKAIGSKRCSKPR